MKEEHRKREELNQIIQAAILITIKGLYFKTEPRQFGNIGKGDNSIGWCHMSYV